MREKAPIFEEIIQGYLKHIKQIPSRDECATILGISTTADGYSIPFFQRKYLVTAQGITDEDGREPSHALSVVLCKYLLLCPKSPSTDCGLVTYKDFQDAAPYVGGFRSNTELVITANFTNSLSRLEQRCRQMGGNVFDTEVYCQLAFGFQALPRVPVFLLFNDADEDFPAQATFLFQKNSSSYLDMECLAMVGSALAYRLAGKTVEQ